MIDRIAWGLLALVHLPPALAWLRPSLLTRLYGVAPSNGAFLLLQHRAALFAAVVAVCLWAAADPATRRLTVVAVAISMGSFLVLYVAGGRPQPLATIAIADTVALPVLAFAAWRAFAA